MREKIDDDGDNTERGPFSQSCLGNAPLSAKGLLICKLRGLTGQRAWITMRLLAEAIGRKESIGLVY